MVRAAHASDECRKSALRASWMHDARCDAGRSNEAASAQMLSCPRPTQRTRAQRSIRARGSRKLRCPTADPAHQVVRLVKQQHGGLPAARRVSVPATLHASRRRSDCPEKNAYQSTSPSVRRSTGSIR
jgi:hypothetical protein